MRGMVCGVYRLQRANTLQRKDEKKERHKKSPPSPAKRQREKADGCARRATRAHPHPDTHTTRTHQRTPKRHTYKRWASATHSACRKKKGGWVPYEYSQPPAGVTAATRRKTGTPHTNTHEPPKEKKREKKQKNTPPTQTQTQTHSSKATQRNPNARRDGRTHTAAAHKSGTPREGTKKKKRRRRDGRRRLPPPHLTPRRSPPSPAVACTHCTARRPAG